MKKLLVRPLVVCLATAIAFACFSTQRAAAQDPTLKSNFGEVKLDTGYTPDPFKKSLVAGGDRTVTINNVRMKITRAPDFKLYYTAGDTFPLSFYVRSAADTTLLIHMPEGGYVANDDGGGNLNPLITIKSPPSGRYDIWVGTFNDEAAPAVLYITELPVKTPIPN